MSAINREQAMIVLSHVIEKEQNIKIMEKCIYEKSNKNPEKYNDILYQTIGDLLNKKKLSDVLSSIKSNKTGWNHCDFQEFQDQLNEQDDFIENPFEVAEGVLECKKVLKNGKVCGSKRVFSYSKQTRSADEPMTTFATCCACGTKWTYSG
jgi:DNA-directed RNA polymerase subunit M/transcription elongation factor TFIIS